jgi:DNA-binding transcriptional LysR family regulator
MVAKSTTDVELAHLRLLALAVELGGLSAAARKLRIPKASATRQLQRLEAVVGRPLAHRNGRSFTVTEAGRALLLDARPAIDAIDDAVSSLRESRDALSGTLRVAAAYRLGCTLIANALPGFMAAHPALHVALDLGSRHVDLLADEADVAIRVGAHGSDRLVVKRLFSERVILCAAPRYLEKAGAPVTLKTLARHRLLDFRAGPATRELTLTRGERRVTTRITPMFTANDPEPIRRVTEAGSGIAAMPRSFIEDSLASGALVEVLPGWSLRGAHVNAVYLAERGRSRNVRAFVDHMIRFTATLENPVAR